MKRACIVALWLVVALIGMGLGLSPGRSLLATIGETPPQPTVWLVLVRNAPTPTPTPSPTPTATPTPTPLPAHVRVAPWCCQFDPPGNDGDRYNEEYVCLENDGGQTAHLAGWSLRDEAGNTYTFPAFDLPPGAWVRIHTGSGVDTATDLYWGRQRFVWNNDRDTVFLYDARGVLVETYTY